jgi:hypothetical protein
MTVKSRSSRSWAWTAAWSLVVVKGPTPAATPNSGRRHEPGDPLAAAADTVLVFELEVDPGATIGLPALFVDAADLVQD